MHAILFVTKVIFWFISGSVAVISDWFHSWVDVFTAIIIWFATKISKKWITVDYQFWYWKAQPIAAFFVAVMAWVTWFEISKYWFEKLFNPQPLTDHLQLILVMFVMIIFSWTISFLMTYIWKINKNSAMIASWRETIWDVLISFSALVWVILVYFFDIYWVDPLLAVFIWVMILKIAYEIIMENLEVLMWARATDSQLIEIQNFIFNKFPKVLAIHDVYSQKLSDSHIYLVIHCEIKDDKQMLFKEAHDLEEDIQFSLEGLDFVQKAVVHLDFHNDSTINRIVK